MYAHISCLEACSIRISEIDVNCHKLEAEIYAIAVTQTRLTGFDCWRTRVRAMSRPKVIGVLAQLGWPVPRGSVNLT